VGLTRLIIGNKMKPKAMESLYMGCCELHPALLPEGRIEKKAFKQAERRGARQVQRSPRATEKEGLKEAVGPRARRAPIAEILARGGRPKAALRPWGSRGCSVLAAGDLRQALLAGLPEDGVPVVAERRPRSCRACSRTLRSLA